MTFWQSELKDHKWISRPEQHAKSLLLTFLLTTYKNTALIFDEIIAGAGLIDIFIALSNDEKAVIELKMCGLSYSLNYAREGIDQIHHYIENRNARAGYLLVFDGRKRDFGKDIPSDVTIHGSRIISKIVDVRPIVKLR